MEKFVRTSAADAATQQLREAIVLGDLALGSPLSEAGIAERLGTSRTPVREALRRLEQEGLVQIRPYSGAAVFSLTEAEVMDLLQFREILELAALHAALDRDAAALAQRWAAVLLRMEEALARQSLRDYVALDSEFHGVLVRAGGSAHLEEAYARIAAKISALRNILQRDAAMLGKSIQGHRDLHALAAQGDRQGAGELLRAHLRNAQAMYRQESLALPRKA